LGSTGPLHGFGDSLEQTGRQADRRHLRELVVAIRISVIRRWQSIKATRSWCGQWKLFD